jgi:3-deoxy-7-phosphoheptulonate synthase
VRDEIGGSILARLGIAPDEMARKLLLSAAAAGAVRASTLAVGDVLDGLDDRLLVAVGPCSIHDVNAGLAYGSLLSDLADDLLTVMQVYGRSP